MKMLEHDSNGRSRSSIKFRDWVEPGMAITGEKLREDALMFRTIASMVSAPNYAGALRSLADQYEMAANGEEPQAK